MKVAVTGATGFIGRHVLERLEKENVDIVAIGRNKDKWNGIGTFVEFDIGTTNENIYQELGRPDVLIHLAWGGLSNYKSLHHFEKELPIQYAFIKSMVNDGLEHISVAGTCFEYGMVSGKLKEDQTAFRQTPYGFAKDILRRQLEYLSLEMNIKLNWLRLFYIWGEGQASNSIYPQLLKSIANNEKSFKMSGGAQVRDYLHVSEVADYMVSIALKPTSEGIINVSSGQPISIRDLVEIWISENNWNIELELGYYPYPEYEPMIFWGDNEKLLSLVTDNDMS